jgi:GT2 family glycosyltransferase
MVAINVRSEDRRDAEIAALEDRIRRLEDAARRTYADMLEVSSVLDQPRPFRHSDRQVVSAAADLRALFASLEPRRAGVQSLVTVVIPVYQKIDYTLCCLRSIAVNWETSINPTIVVVDDASPDGSAAHLLGIPGVNLIQNGTNLGYLRSTNRGALIAQTPFVCFLNNDTEVKPGWLGWLVETMYDDPKIGAVGSKLVYPDGTLQEAGSIIWSDATGWNYGRGRDPFEAAFNVRRDVDFCSAASLLIRTELLREIGGFDERYAPAYYEDADLCFEVRARGFRTVYEPRSEIVHYEGISSGTDIASGVKRYQEVNRPKFAEKWAAILPSHFPPSPDNVEAAVKFIIRKTILVVDSYVPMHDREAGSARLFKIIGIFCDLGLHVIFLPHNFASVEPYTTDLVRLGVEVLFDRPGGRDRGESLRMALRQADAVWVCRPELCEHYLPLVRGDSRAPFVYDTIDLHFAREQQRVALEGGDDHTWRRLQELELRMCRSSDLVVTVTDVERQQLAAFDIGNVAVIPTIHDIEEHESFGFDPVSCSSAATAIRPTSTPRFGSSATSCRSSGNNVPTFTSRCSGINRRRRWSRSAASGSPFPDLSPMSPAILRKRACSLRRSAMAPA